MVGETPCSWRAAFGAVLFEDLKMAPTKASIHAAALDAAERSRRARGAPVIDEEADDAYHAEFDRLLALIGGQEGWIDLPEK